MWKPLMIHESIDPNNVLKAVNRTCAFGQVFGMHRQVWISVRDIHDWKGAKGLLFDSGIDYREAPGFQENL